MQFFFELFPLDSGSITQENFCGINAGIYHRTGEAGKESGSHVKGKNAGNVLRTKIYTFITLHIAIPWTTVNTL